MSTIEKNDEAVNALGKSSGTFSLGGELSVRRLGFGAMRLTGNGIWGPPSDPAAALAVLRSCVELGVNFIDTADSYGPSVNEEYIAKALAPYPKDLVVATKGGWNRPGPDQWTHDASPAHLREAIEGSLKRLRLSRIDLYQLHATDPAISFDASVETLAELQSEGKIRFVGLSNVTKEHIERARKIVPIVSVQNRYSFADREWDYVVDYCERSGRRLSLGIPWQPAKPRAWHSKRLLRTIRGRPCRWRSLGCSSAPRLCCPFPGLPRSRISKKICRQLPYKSPTQNMKSWRMLSSEHRVREPKLAEK